MIISITLDYVDAVLETGIWILHGFCIDFQV